jgi:hypothetical protein
VQFLEPAGAIKGEHARSGVVKSAARRDFVEFRPEPAEVDRRTFD